MDNQDAVVAHLNRLDRRITRIGAAVLGLLAVGLFVAMAFQDPETVAVQDIVRTQRLELSNAEGKTVAVLAATQSDALVVRDEQATDRMPVRTYHNNGRKFSEGTLVNGKLDGRWIMWDQNGSIQQVGEYQEGLRVGMWIHYFSGFGTLYQEGRYAEGLREGLWRKWHLVGDNDEWNPSGYFEPGPLASSGTFLKGKRYGIWTVWWSNGNQRAQGEYNEDRRVGDWKVWYEDGSIDEEQTGVYENGEKIR